MELYDIFKIIDTLDSLKNEKIRINKLKKMIDIDTDINNIDPFVIDELMILFKSKEGINKERKLKNDKTKVVF